MVSFNHDNSTERLQPAVPSDLPSQTGLATRLKSLARWGLLRSAVPFRRWLGRAAEGSFGILMYHRITPNVPGVPSPTWNVTPQQCRRQLAGLLRRGFRPFRLRDLIDHYDTGTVIPANGFAVTFDDGYANNYTQALPILRDLNVPATIFLATGYLDSDRPFPIDDWSAAGSPDVPDDSWRMLTSDEAARLNADDLIELGAHTHTHADFRDRPEALRADLAECLSVLATKFGIENPTFAFPYGTKHLGFVDAELTSVARSAGVRCALTTESEIITPQRSPFEWGRFHVNCSDTGGTLAVKLTGGFDLMRRISRRGSFADLPASRQRACASTAPNCP